PRLRRLPRRRAGATPHPPLPAVLPPPPDRLLLRAPGAAGWRRDGARRGAARGPAGGLRAARPGADVPGPQPPPAPDPDQGLRPRRHRRRGPPGGRAPRRRPLAEGHIDRGRRRPPVTVGCEFGST